MSYRYADLLLRRFFHRFDGKKWHKLLDASLAIQRTQLAIQNFTDPGLLCGMSDQVFQPIILFQQRIIQKERRSAVHSASPSGLYVGKHSRGMIQRADQPSTGIISTIIATVTLLMGAAGFFGQLKDALNTVWGIEPKAGRGVWGFVKDNFLSFATLLGTAFLLLVSLVLSTALAAIGKWFGNLLPLPEIVLQAFNFLLSLVVITGLFALIFKVLPDAHTAWRDVWVGAALTAVLFTIGKFAIELYLGKSNVGSSYGAAGSLVLVLVWVYYSVQILLYGAEFTQVYANLMGQHIQPTEEAKVVDPEKTPEQSRKVISA